MKLKGRIALVTGAGRGIGRGIAEVFAADGADVAVNDLAEPEDVAQALRATGRALGEGRKGQSIFVDGGWEGK